MYLKKMKYINNYILLFSVISFLLYSWPFTKNIFLNNGNIFLNLNLTFIGFLLTYLIYLIILNKYTNKFIILLFPIINSLSLYFMNNFSAMINHDSLINLLETNISEMTEFINIKLFCYIIFLGIIPSILLLKILSNNKNNINNKTRFVHIGIILLYFILNLTITLFSSNYLIFLKKNKNKIHYLVPINYTKATIDVIKTQSVLENKQIIELIDIKEQTTINNNKKTLIVFIVGESARANNFSLNGYNKDTNKLLNGYDIINFSNFYSCGTSTFVSVPCIFSHLERKDFSVKNFQKYENLLDIFNKLNYKINWYSNSGDCKKVCDRTNFKITNEKYDVNLLNYLKKDVKNNTNNNLFIVLHQRGSHGPKYDERYPNEFEIFTPICGQEMQNCNRDEIINSYDNTIYYTSYFIKETIDFLKTKANEYNVMLVYVSDHGDSLKEDGQIMHGYPYIFANNFQKHIPFILWFSNGFINDYNIDLKYLKHISNNMYSHDNIFHSMLGLFNIKSKFYKQELDIFKKI